jgi:hypothetical protein
MFDCNPDKENQEKSLKIHKDTGIFPVFFL